MMVEIVDNAIQLAVTAVCAVCAAICTLKTRKQAYLILTCFYGVCALGSLYWLLYLVLTSYTPRVFYVSDLSWCACFLFLLVFVTALSTPEEKRFRHNAVWISPAIGAALTLFYFQWGDYLTNVIWCGLTSVIGWFSLRGFLFASRAGARDEARRRFHLSVLALLFLEYCLWTASCFWVSDTLTNPYFWFDLLLSGVLAAMLPAARGVVEQ